MTRTNFLVGVAVSLVLPLACLLYGLSAAQPANASASAAALAAAPAAREAAAGGADINRVQQRFVQLLKMRAAR